MRKSIAIPGERPKTPLDAYCLRSPVELKAWPSNPRTHPDKQLAKLKASIAKYGFTAPVLVDETGVILAGHARTQAAKELGLGSIPTLTLSGLTQAEKRAYVIGDNKLALLSGWNQTLLKSDLELLIQEDFEVEITGFSTGEIDLMFEEPAADTDEIQDEDIVDEAVAQPGDLWELGSHRLLCGSALEAGSYSALLDGEQVQLCLTDPPYNVPINGHVCGKGRHKHKEFVMASGELSRGQFTSMLTQALGHIHASGMDGAISQVFMDWRHVPELLDAARPLFGDPRQLCVWDKQSAGMGTFYRSQHELVYVFKKGDAPHINNFELGQHGRFRSNVWSYPGSRSGQGRKLHELHPTVKPVPLIADAIRDCSHRKGLVLDPFAGSGTILIAAERTGRHARAIELDPRYVDIAIRRWQRLTGKSAIHLASGASWDDVRMQRAKARE